MQCIGNVQGMFLLWLFFSPVYFNIHIKGCWLQLFYCLDLFGKFTIWIKYPDMKFPRGWDTPPSANRVRSPWLYNQMIVYKLVSNKIMYIFFQSVLCFQMYLTYPDPESVCTYRKNKLWLIRSNISYIQKYNNW